MEIACVFYYTLYGYCTCILTTTTTQIHISEIFIPKIRIPKCVQQLLLCTFN